MIKNIFIIIGFGLLSIVISIVYMFGLPYIAWIVTIGLFDWDKILVLLSPPPIAVFVSAWICLCGYYFIKPALVTAAYVVLVVSIVFNTVVLVVSYFY